MEQFRRAKLPTPIERFAMFRVFVAMSISVCGGKFLIRADVVDHLKHAGFDAFEPGRTLASCKPAARMPNT
jgi:hypothetical protein